MAMNLGSQELAQFVDTESGSEPECAPQPEVAIFSGAGARDLRALGLEPRARAPGCPGPPGPGPVKLPSPRLPRVPAFALRSRRSMARCSSSWRLSSSWRWRLAARPGLLLTGPRPPTGRSSWRHPTLSTLSKNLAKGSLHSPWVSPGLRSAARRTA